MDTLIYDEESFLEINNEEENLDKERILQMDLTLTNIRKNLIIAFKLLDQHVKTGEYTKAVIAVGDTGCGKSTLLSAIILGS